VPHAAISQCISVLLECPIIHVIRLYLPDGSNVDACRKEMIEDGIEIAVPGND